MPMDYLAMQDSATLGYQQYKNWHKEWKDQFLKGLRDTVEAIAIEKAIVEWERIPDQIREQMKQQDPEGYEKAQSLLRDMEKKLSRGAY